MNPNGSAGPYLPRNGAVRQPRGPTPSGTGFFRGRGIEEYRSHTPRGTGSRGTSGVTTDFESRGNSGSTRGNRARGNSLRTGRGDGHYTRGQHRGSSRSSSFAAESELLSATKLKELLKKDVEDVIMYFHMAGDGFDNALKRKVLNDESLPLFVEILGDKFCGASALETIRNSLVSRTCIAEFLDQLDLTYNLLVEEPTADTAQLLRQLYSFYRFVGDKMPNMAADSLMRLVQAATPIFMRISKDDMTVELEELSSKYEILHCQMKEFKEKRDECLKGAGAGDQSSEYLARRRREFERSWMVPAPEDFRSLPLIPSAEEITSGYKPFLRPSIVKGKYPSVEDYLDVHFRLLREDFVHPLREGVQEFYKTRDGKRKPPQGTVKIYRRVKLLPGMNLNTTSPSFTVQLELTPFLQRIKWDRSKRLLNGSLLLFTQHNFESIFFATVSRRDEKDLSTNGTFCITWEGKQPDFKRHSYWDMLECDVFYETYRHTLKALTEMSKDNFPMTKYIIEGASEKTPPPYLTTIEEPLDFKILMASETVEKLRIVDPNYGFAKVLNTSDWPSASELGMDNSQYEAFQAAMTQELSIIQGPPGTGKTFIGIQIAKFLLANKQHFLPSWKTEIVEIQVDDYETDRHGRRIKTGHTGYKLVKKCVNTHGNTPVLVVCYTNHALDQFLEAIHHVMIEMGMKPEQELVRVGGQSKSEVMKELNMFKRLQDAVKQQNISTSFLRDYKVSSSALRSIKQGRHTVLEMLRSLVDPLGIVDFYDVMGDCRTDVRPNLDWSEYDFICALHRAGSCTAWHQFGMEVNAQLGFNSSQRMEAMFNFRLPKQAVSLVPESKSAESSTPAVEDDDGENYDLEELTANRIEELSYEVAEMSGKNVSIPYVISPLQELESWRERQKDAEKQRERGAADGNNLTLWSQRLQRIRAEEDISSCKNEIQSFENKRNLLDHIFTAHASGQLKLPPVTEEIIEASTKRFTCMSGEAEIDQAIDAATKKPGRREGDKITAEQFRENWAVYFHCLAKVREALLKQVVKLEESLVERTKEFKDVENYGYSLVLQKVKFIGVTTTGAAKYNSVLKLIKSKMVIVEEAAEVLESHIVTSITNHCQHLVLIGDHLQLRPKTTVFRLGKDFNLDVSLFERMINNETNAHVLEIQHRMRPEICDLLVPTIYKSLVNHESVDNYPDVRGIISNLFFISHTEPEMGEADGMSKSNEHEARFLARLCRHLVLQGYEHDRITILTTYVGQMFLIKKIINKMESCRGVRVTAVDNFQGEENDIILLSLVRSNEENQIGFLNTDNRVCVAISRAKHGFYVIGNMDSMESKSNTWKLIREKLEAKGNIGASLPLKCSVHGDITLVTNPEDFSNAPEGGCLKNCEASLEKCAHRCRLACHANDRSHMEYKCQFPCGRMCVKNGHRCVGRCYEEPCPNCNVTVLTVLNCGHSVTLRCYQDAELYNCVVPVLRQLSCAHELVMPCHEDPTLAICYEDVIKILPCTHGQEAKCFESLEEIKCTTLVTVTLPDCLHTLTLACHMAQLPPESWECESRCDTRLECGHSCTKKCHTQNDPNHDNYTCQKECSRSCPNEHVCMASFRHKHKCHTSCPPCLIPISLRLSCDHEAKMNCVDSRDEVSLSNFKCQVQIVKQSIDCPHEITVSCSQEAEKKLCSVQVEAKVLSACGHPVKVPCAVQETLTPEECMAYCHEPCGQVLSLEGVGCQHICTGTCSSCFNGRMHQRCKNKCGRVLICGHPCKSPCSQVCPPCEQNCIMSCEHSRCRRPCGEPCTPCKERCGWKCPHARCTKLCGEKCNREPCPVQCTLRLNCGHPCVGLCNEPCPPCVICHKEITEVFLGHEDENGAKFVVLQECGHAFEVRDLDKWMNLESETKDSQGILVRRCPRCQTVVEKSRRYGGILKECMKDVMQVKTKIFGGTDESLKSLQKLGQRLETLQTSSQLEYELIFFGNFLRQFIFKDTFSAQKNRFKKVDQYKLESLSHMMNWWEDACVDKTKLSDSLRTDLTSRYHQMFGTVKSRGLPLSQLEIKQFNMEFRRLNDIYQLYRRGSTEVVKETTLLPLYDAVKQVVLTKLPYTSNSEAEFKTKLSELDVLLKRNAIALAGEKRRTWETAHRAIASTATSWYRCNCGYIYAVGDCGQLNESGNCPKCKNRIGGGSANPRVADAHEPPILNLPTPEVLDF